MNLSDRCRTRTLDVVIFPGCKAIEAVATIHIFDDANSRLVAAGLPPVYDIKLTGPKLGVITTDTLVTLTAKKQLDALAVPEMAIIVGSAKHRGCALRQSGADRMVPECIFPDGSHGRLVYR